MFKVADKLGLEDPNPEAQTYLKSAMDDEWGVSSFP
jgi:hypothetical protein